MPLITNSSCNEVINNINLEILISGYLRSGTEWSKVRYYSPHYSKLYFILGGDAYICYNGVKHELRAGRAYLIPTDLIYDNGCETGIDFLYFNIRLTNKSGYDFLSCYPELLEIEYPRERTLALIEKYRSGELIDWLILKDALTEAVLSLISTAPEIRLTNKKYSECVSRALEYIHAHLSIRLGIDEICASVYAARSTLSKKFTEEVGLSIGAYIDAEIMSRCEQLLIDTDLSIGQISERFGFCDQFYFSRRFKEKFGVTPAACRRGAPAGIVKD